MASAVLASYLQNFAAFGVGLYKVTKKTPGCALSHHEARHMGVAQNERARVTHVLVFGSIYQGAILVHFF